MESIPREKKIRVRWKPSKDRRRDIETVRNPQDTASLGSIERNHAALLCSAEDANR